MRGIRLACTAMVLLFIIALSASVALAQITIDIDPDSLNLDSKGRWITCYILGAGINPTGLTAEIETIDGIPVLLAITGEKFQAGDYDDDGVDDCLMAKFNRSDVQAAIIGLATPPGNVMIGVAMNGVLYTDTIYAF